MKRKQCGCWNENKGPQLDDQGHHQVIFSPLPEQRGSVRSCHDSDIQPVSYENIHQVPRAEIKAVQRLLICWVLRAQGRPRMGEVADCPLTYSSHPVLCLALLQGGACTDSIPALRLLIWVEDNTHQNSGWWRLWRELNFWMLLIQKLVNNIYSSMVKNEMLPFAATWMDLVNIEIRLIVFFAAKDGEALYSQQKQDQELTVAQIMNSLLPNSKVNWRKWGKSLEHSVQFSSVAQSCLILSDPMNYSTPGLSVHHQLPEFTQTRVHQVSDAIQPSHPLSSPSSPAPNPSQHQSLFQWVNSSHEVAKVLEVQLQHQSFQWTSRRKLQEVYIIILSFVYKKI